MTPGIEERVREVRARIERACRRVGRDPLGVTLLGASKHQPVEVIARAAEAGLTDFGENYVQELLKKQEALSGRNLRWHAIGRLQTNKVRQIVGRVTWIHTVDRLELIEELDRQGMKKGCGIDVLLEVNLGEETSKAGAPPSRLKDLLTAARRTSSVRVLGLMSLPPYRENPEESRADHRRLADLARWLREESGAPLPELSMGMSHDLEAAVEEGATLVRVGEALFGPRPRPGGPATGEEP